MAKKRKPKQSWYEHPYGMHVEFETAHLRERLALFRHIIVKRATRKDLASYHFTLREDGSCILAGTDLENRLQVKMNVVKKYGSGQVMIDSQALNAMMGGYAEQTVLLQLDDPKKVKIEGRHSKLVLPGYDPALELKATAEGSLTTSGWMVRGDYLATAIEKTRFAAAKDESTRYALSGLAIRFPDEGEQLAQVVATTGQHLSLYRVPVKPFGQNPERFWRPHDATAVMPTIYIPIIGNKVVPLVLALAKGAGSDPVGIAVIPADTTDLEKKKRAHGQIQIVTRDAVLTSKIPEGRFPRHEDVYPTGTPQGELRLEDASTLGSFLASVWCATDTEHKAVEMVMAGGCLMMTTESETKGKAVISLLVPDSSGRVTFDIDAFMVRQFFDAIGNERLWMGVFGKKDPIVFKAGLYHDYILMPISRDGARVVEDAKPKPEAVAPTPEPAPAPPETPPQPHEGNGHIRVKKS